MIHRNSPNGRFTTIAGSWIARTTRLFRSAEDIATIDQDVSEFIEASHVKYTTETVVVSENP